MPPCCWSLPSSPPSGLVLVCFTAPTSPPARLPVLSMFGGLKLNNLFAKGKPSPPLIINVAFQGTRTGITVFMAAFAWRSWGSPISACLPPPPLSWAGSPAPPSAFSLDKKGPIATPDPRRPVLLCRPPVSRLCPGSDLVHYLRYPDRNRPEWHFSRTDDHLYAPFLRSGRPLQIPPTTWAWTSVLHWPPRVGGVLCAVFGYRVGFAAFVVPVVLAVALAVVILSRLEKQERTALTVSLPPHFGQGCGIIVIFHPRAWGAAQLRVSSPSRSNAETNKGAMGYALRHSVHCLGPAGRRKGPEYFAESPANCQVVLSNTQILRRYPAAKRPRAPKVLIAFGMFAKIVRQSVDVPVIMVDLQAEDVMDALLRHLAGKAHRYLWLPPSSEGCVLCPRPALH